MPKLVKLENGSSQVKYSDLEEKVIIKLYRRGCESHDKRVRKVLNKIITWR